MPEFPTSVSMLNELLRQEEAARQEAAKVAERETAEAEIKAAEARFGVDDDADDAKIVKALDASLKSELDAPHETVRAEAKNGLVELPTAPPIDSARVSDASESEGKKPSTRRPR